MIDLPLNNNKNTSQQFLSSDTDEYSKRKRTNCCIRSLVMVRNQLPAQRGRRTINESFVIYWNCNNSLQAFDKLLLHSSSNRVARHHGTKIPRRCISRSRFFATRSVLGHPGGGRRESRSALDQLLHTHTHTHTHIPCGWHLTERRLAFTLLPR